LRSLDRALADSRYKRIDPSLVLTVGRGGFPATSGRQFEMLEIDSWLNVYCHLSGMPKTAARLQKLVLKSIPHDAIYGAIKSSAGHVACGLVVIDDEFIGLFDILTHPNYRRQGYARQLILNLLHCGSEKGAHTGNLQVAKDNKPALALYKHIGFQSLYRSWYRIRQGLGTRSVDSA
ncbi:MAG: GNAT family N-acetyltransferase, partial [Pseudomonadales bacterium]|nr:GNAT family N-acetyltransferase [Pseudomonadales bacterium]